MGGRCDLLAYPLALLVLGVGAVGVAAAQTSAPITGTLDKPGYAVLAIAANGQTSTAFASGGAFSVVPTQPAVTLHLRGPDGTYAGPIVPRLAVDPLPGARRAVKAAVTAVTRARRAVRTATRAVTIARRAARRAHGRQAERAAIRRLSAARTRLAKARRALTKARRRRALAQSRLATEQTQAATRANAAPLGIRAGAPLGAIEVNIVGGYAVAETFTRAAWKQWIDATLAGQSQLGVPIGAGNFGRVASARHDGAASGDLDLDGIPGPLDVDDDGDLVLDDVDAAAGGRAVTRGTFPDGSRIQVNTLLQTHEEGATSANGGSTDAQIAEAQAGFGELNIFWTGFDDAAELDCADLGYCKAGGTGMIRTDPVNPYREKATPFPACCDADGDGLGTLTKSVNFPGQVPGAGAMSILHGATVEQIGTGDILIARGTVGGVPVESATTVGFAYSTASVVKTVDDGQGNVTTFTYPRPTRPPPPTPVRAGPDGTLTLTLTLWRPQRERIAGEAGDGRWIDMGGLNHGASVFVPGAGHSDQATVFCPASSVTEDDPNLTILEGSETAKLRDGATDKPADPANTFTYTLNVTRCIATRGLRLAAGADAYLNFQVSAPAEQGRSGGAVSALHVRVDG